MDSAALMALKVRGDAALRDLQEIAEAAMNHLRSLQLNDIPGSHRGTPRE